MSDRIDQKVRWLFEVSPVLRGRKSLDVTVAQARHLAAQLCAAEDHLAAKALEQTTLAATSGYDASEITRLQGIPDKPQ